MYLASPRASPSWTSITGREIEDYCGHMQTAGRQSVVDMQGEDIALQIFYRYLRRFTDTECILFSFFWGFVSYPIRSSLEHALIYLLSCPDDRAPRWHTHSTPPQYPLKKYPTTTKKDIQ
jgi:hypothetical protein